jgi:hypothetical protein
MEGIWPLVIIWVLFSIFGSRKKRGQGPAAGSQGEMPGGFEPRTPDSRPQSLPDQFRAALEELKRAEQEAMRGRQQPSLPTEPPARAAAPTMAERQAKKFAPRTFAPRPAQGKFVRRQASLPVAEADESSEDVTTVEGLADYDEEAEAIIQKRRAAADRLSTRRPGSIEEMTPEQAARRSSRPDLAIGSRQEHDEWHVQMQATEIGVDRAEKKRRNPLAKYADGTMKSVIILNEILGRPKAEQ